MGPFFYRDSFGREQRYSECLLSNDREMIKHLNSDDAHDLGYRVGFRDGFDFKKYKGKSSLLKDKILNLINFQK